MNKLLLIFFTVLSFTAQGQVTGNAFLFGQSDHSGIKIKFIPHSGTAQLDSTYTNTNGSYSINLNGGLYQVLFTKAGYQDFYYSSANTFAIATTAALNDITLQSGIAAYISGNASGSWSSDTVYVINGDITIPTGTTLTIEAGTVVKFNGNYSILANGTLRAIGTDNSKIVFTSNLAPTAGDWNKIALNSSTSIVDHCIIEYCKYGFYFSGSSPTITNNEIRNFSDGGIYCWNGSPLISNNTVHNYHGQYYSWGIWVEGFSHSTIECNKTYDGSGYGIITKSNTIVKNNIIYNITNGSRGKGIWVSNECNALIKNNFISGCRIGIDVSNSDSTVPHAQIINNTIFNNTDAGIYFNDQYARGSVINNIITNNKYGIKQDVPGCAPWPCWTTPDSVTHNIVWNNTSGNYYNVQIIGLGQIVTVNANGDPIDSYYNLAQDPVYIGNIPPVLESSSPCFNAGESNFSLNIGYDTSYSCQSLPLSTSETNFEKNTSITIYPNPFSSTTQINLNNAFESADLKIYNALGGQIRQQKIISQTTTINRDGLQAGIYFYQLTCSTGIVLSGKLVIQ